MLVVHDVSLTLVSQNFTFINNIIQILPGLYRIIQGYTSRFIQFYYKYESKESVLVILVNQSYYCKEIPMTKAGTFRPKRIPYTIPIILQFSTNSHTIPNCHLYANRASEFKAEIIEHAPQGINAMNTEKQRKNTLKIGGLVIRLIKTSRKAVFELGRRIILYEICFYQRHKL